MVSGYRASCFKEPVECALRVLSDRREGSQHWSEINVVAPNPPNTAL